MLKALDYESDAYGNRFSRPAPSPRSGGEVMAQKFTIALDADLEDGHFCGLVALPPNCLPINIFGFNTDLDTNGTPAIVADIGIMNTLGTGLIAGSELLDGSTFLQAAGSFAMDDHAGVWLPATWKAQTNAPDKDDPIAIAMEIITTAGTAAAGTIYGIVQYMEASFGK